MLKLHYIIIGEMDECQKQYIEENVRENEEGKEGKIEIISWNESKRHSMTVLLARQSIFISGNYTQLQEAIDFGMATIGYLQQTECAREHEGEIAENIACRETTKCPCTDMWAEGFEEVDLEFLTHVFERHHGIPWTILTTKRCVIREFSMDYLDALFELYSGEGMTDYMEPLYPYEQEKEYQEAYIKNMYGFYGYGMWLVCEKDTGKLIGRAGVEHREELNGEMELGYAIGVPYQRQGYATEVCKAILTYVKEKLLETSICCLIEKENERSRALAKKLGFQLEEEVYIDGKHMEKYVYSFDDCIL